MPSPLPAPERVVFSHVVDGLIVRALAREVPPALVERFKKLGLDLTRKLNPAYPAELWNRVLEATGETLSPGQPAPEVMQRLGERMIEGYRATLVGQAVLAMAALIGPRRALLRSRQNWRSGNNYSEVKLEELGPTEFRATFNEQGVSRWVSQGILRAGLTFAGGKRVKVDIESYTEADVTYRIAWG